ncbi:MAG: DUF2953 domain-containing protein [Oscillospiraceae bacterium]|nr:DUF2953 domain-containing protein [Oscillospiraceae bacterium]
MPIYVYILIGLFLLSFLTLFMRIGVEYRFAEPDRLTLRMGLLRKTISLKKAEKTAKKAEGSAEDAAKKAVKKTKKPLPKPKIGAAEVKSGMETLLPALKRALGKTRRSVRFHPLNLHIIMGGSDPAELAKLYGWAHALLWSVMPEMERLLVIPDPHIRLDVNFEADRTRTEGEFGCGIRIISILLIVMTLLVPALQWYKSLPKAEPATTPAAQRETQANSENTQTEAPAADKPPEPKNTTRGE